MIPKLQCYNEISLCSRGGILCVINLVHKHQPFVQRILCVVHVPFCPYLCKWMWFTGGGGGGGKKIEKPKNSMVYEK
jgi:hypothetical protein